MLLVKRGGKPYEVKRTKRINSHKRQKLYQKYLLSNKNITMKKFLRKRRMKIVVRMRSVIN
jgi:hypothetical protein